MRRRHRFAVDHTDALVLIAGLAIVAFTFAIAARAYQTGIEDGYHAARQAEQHFPSREP